VNVYYTADGERGYEDIASLYESFRDDWDDDNPADRRDLHVEEWSTHPVRKHVSSDNMLDHVVEHLLEYDLEEVGDEDGTLAAKIEDRARDPLVRMRFTAFVDLLFKGVSWWVAGKVVATHRITHDDNGEPLFDGKPLYVKRDADA
jgi:hypothetical protein